MMLYEFVEMHGRGHALTVDHGWRDVADTALNFIRRFVGSMTRLFDLSQTRRRV